MPSQKPGTARNKMLIKRARLSARLLGRSALRMAMGMPTNHDSTTDKEGDLRGERPAPQDHLGHAFGAEERAAEVAARDILRPRPVLLHSGSLSPSSAM